MISILIVDDEPLILRSMVMWMRRGQPSWAVTTVVSGADAVLELSRARFDVVVSDMRMRGMDGIELLDHVRTAYPHVVRILLSGHAEQETRDRAQNVAQLVVTKPCLPRDLAVRIEAIVTARPEARTAL